MKLKTRFRRPNLPQRDSLRPADAATRSLTQVLSARGRTSGFTGSVLVVARKQRQLQFGPGVRTVIVRPSNRERLPTLLALGPFDLVIDLTGKGLQGRAASEFFSLNPGGLFVARLARTPGGSRPKPLQTWLANLLAGQEGGLVKGPGGRSSAAKRARDQASLASAMRRVEIAGDWLIAENNVSAVQSLPDAHVEAFAALADPRDTIIARHPPTVLKSRATVRYTRKPSVSSIPSEYAVPRLSMRTYGNAWSIPGQVLARDLAVFPESFRRVRSNRRRSSTLDQISRDIFAAPELRGPRLEGPWFALDGEIHNHFGHVLTEQLSHVWGVEEALAQFPDLGFILHDRPGEPVSDWTLRILIAAGVPEDRIKSFDGPVQVERLVATTPAYAIGDYVHPIMLPIYRQVGAALAGDSPADGLPDRVFFSRNSTRRQCLNREEVEGLFQQHGFQVVQPELLDLSIQFALVRRASIIAGFAGSAMFHIGFADAPKTCILIHSDSYHAHNEHQFAALQGHDLHLIVCDPDISRPGGKFTGESYRSAFTADLHQIEQMLLAL